MTHNIHPKLLSLKNLKRISKKSDQKLKNKYPLIREQILNCIENFPVQLELFTFIPQIKNYQFKVKNCEISNNLKICLNTNWYEILSGGEYETVDILEENFQEEQIIGFFNSETNNLVYLMIVDEHTDILDINYFVFKEINEDEDISSPLRKII